MFNPSPSTMNDLCRNDDRPRFGKNTVLPGG
jgi:hypothetical protein